MVTKKALSRIDIKRRKTLKIIALSPIAFLIPNESEAFWNFILGLAVDIFISSIERRAAITLLGVGAAALRSASVHATERAIIRSATLSAKGKERAKTLLHTVDRSMDVAEFISGLRDYDGELADSYEQNQDNINAIWSKKTHKHNNLTIVLGNKNSFPIKNGYMEITIVDSKSGELELKSSSRISVPANTPDRKYAVNFRKFKTLGLKDVSIKIELADHELVTDSTIFVV